MYALSKMLAHWWFFLVAVSCNRIHDWRPFENRAVMDAASFNILVHLEQPASGIQELETRFWSVADPASDHYSKFIGNEEIAAFVGAPTNVIERAKAWLLNAGALNVHILPHHDTLSAYVPTAQVAARLLGKHELNLSAYRHITSGKVITRAKEDDCNGSILPDGVRFVAGLCGLPGSPRVDGRSRSQKAIQRRRLTATQCLGCPLIRLVDNPPEISWQPARAGENEDASCIGPASHPTTCPQYFRIDVSNFANGEKVLSKEFSSSSDICDSNLQCDWLVDPAALGSVDGIPTEELSWAVTSIWRDTTSNEEMTTTMPVGAVAGPSTKPDYLRRLYRVPNRSMVTHPDATQAVYEENGNISRSDLEQFFKNTGFSPDLSKHLLTHGGNDEARPSMESTMDVQLIMAMAPGSQTIHWNIDPQQGDGSFLQWAAEIANTTKPPLVHSISWGPAENFATTAGIPGDLYVARVNIELMKMGVRGLTLLFADGDAGATCNPVYGNCSFASPVWPASSPYGLAIGATFLAQGSRTAKSIEEHAMAANGGVSITTGGGFSYKSLRPKHQNAAVESYFRSIEPGSLPPNSFFMHGGWEKNRALPDVAALGIGVYMVITGNDKQAASGASVATPIVAGLVSLLNDARLREGLPPMGPIGPFLYSMTDGFQDITVGENRCFETPTWEHGMTVNDTCCAHGFVATHGYDVVTGLGSPNFEVWRQYALELGRQAHVSRQNEDDIVL